MQILNANVQVPRRLTVEHLRMGGQTGGQLGTRLGLGAMVAGAKVDVRFGTDAGRCQEAGRFAQALRVALIEGARTRLIG